MKKAIYAILAMLTVFAMIMAGCSSDGGGTTTPPGGGTDTYYTVSFNANGGVLGAGTEDQSVLSGGKATRPTNNPTREADATHRYSFENWHTSTDGGTTLSAADFNFATTSITANITLYAKWLTAGVNDVFVTLDGNGGEFSEAELVGTKGQPLADLDEVEMIKAKARSAFTGWNTAANGSGTTYTSASPSIASDAVDFTLYAQWEAAAVSVDRDEAIEQITLGNAWQVVYKFELPDEKAWEDYETIDVTYMITDPEMLTNPNGARSIRLYGNYKPGDFEFLTTDAGSKLAIANFSLGNGEYILADAGGGWKTIQAYFTEKGITAGVAEYFTISYKLDGSTKNGSYKAENKPTDDATGPFYFGLGIAGQDIPTTSIIKEVKMVGYTSADTFNATPAYFTNSAGNEDGTADTYEYPAFVGYGNKDGSAAEDDAKRKVVTKIAKEFAQAVGPETTTMMKGYQALYKFTPAEDKTWEDYETIDVTYVIPDDATLFISNGARAIRLYGNYKISQIELLDTTAGNHLGIANFTVLGNGEFIFADAGGGWKNISTFLIEKGLRFKDAGLEESEIDLDNPVYTGIGAGDEFTIKYKLDGSTKNGSYVAANKPADAATGPFYYGLGIAGEDPAVTVVIKAVKMVGYTSADTVDGAPLYFKNALDTADATVYPGFVAYGNTNGSAGEDVANREPYVEP